MRWSLKKEEIFIRLMQDFINGNGDLLKIIKHQFHHHTVKTKKLKIIQIHHINYKSPSKKTQL
jgi:hypothetical protein